MLFVMLVFVVCIPLSTCTYAIVVCVCGLFGCVCVFVVSIGYCFFAFPCLLLFLCAWLFVSFLLSI